MFRALRRLAPIALLVPLALAPASASHASVPTSYCAHRSYKSVVRNYTRGGGHYPLRCGTATWGFKHITHRWNAAFDAKIALTIARGEQVADVQQDGGTAIFALFNDRCTELFRVIYNGGAYRGNGIRPQGIITAYDRTIITTIAADGADANDTNDPQAVDAADSTAADDAVETAVQPDVADAATYRTDCPVYQGI